MTGERLSDFDFDLPADRIALRPAEPRDTARLLVVATPERLIDTHVFDLPTWLRPGDVLVLNDTRVIPARLLGVRLRGSSRVDVEAMLHQAQAAGVWTAFMRPGRRIAPGDQIVFGEGSDRLEARVEAKGEGGEVTLRFDRSGEALTAAIASVGSMPLPPYIRSRRREDERDQSDYQTVYAREDGSVAAPTAGLHFTDELLGRLASAGVDTARVTLHVGAGTFLPVKSEVIDAHRMHAETGTVTEATAAALNAARGRGGRIICVGTTSLRLLESAAKDKVIHPFAGQTRIFIRPGYAFQAADALLTNFHLPKSTLFMLVSAFSGLETMRRAYAKAIADGYRFYSYGDACLLFPERP